MDEERMRRIEEEMARFENEISLSSDVVDYTASIDANSVVPCVGLGGAAASRMQVPMSHSMQFTPPQLMRNHAMPPPNAGFSSGFPSSTGANQSTVIEAAPSIYRKSANAPKPVEAMEPETSAFKPVMKTMVLPADVELLAAKKQQEVAYKNSYIGQVLRGEKKMKRFIRTAAGDVWEDTSLAEWDPSDFRIFCGDLGNEVSDELLAKAFRKYPSFQKAKVVREKRTNKSKGYGFVSFKDQQDFIRACREMDGKYVGNRPIKLRKSNWKERSYEEVKKKQKAKVKLGMA